MKKRLACPLVLLALLVVLLTPASANSAPTRLGGTGGSALTVDEGCPVTVTAEQLTFLPLREAEERCYTAHFDSLPTGSSPSPSIHASPSPWPTGFTPY